MPFSRLKSAEVGRFSEDIGTSCQGDYHRVFLRPAITSEGGKVTVETLMLFSQIFPGHPRRKPRSSAQRLARSMDNTAIATTRKPQRKIRSNLPSFPGRYGGYHDPGKGVREATNMPGMRIQSTSRKSSLARRRAALGARRLGAPRRRIRCC